MDIVSEARADFLQLSSNYFPKQATREQTDEAQNINLKQILLQFLSLSKLKLWNVGAWKHQEFNLWPSKGILAWNAQEFEFF